MVTATPGVCVHVHRSEVDDLPPPQRFSAVPPGRLETVTWPRGPSGRAVPGSQPVGGEHLRHLRRGGHARHRVDLVEHQPVVRQEEVDPRDTAAAEPVTISCGMVPAHAAQSSTVGSPSSPGPNTTASAPGSTGSSPRSTTVWSIEITPTTGRRRPATSTSASPDAARGRPSAYPSGSNARVVGRSVTYVCPYPTPTP